MDEGKVSFLSFKTKKVRKMFPRKGPEKKALHFLSNLLRVSPNKRKEVYRKVLKTKKGEERRTLIKARKVASQRKEIFQKFNSLVNEYISKYPNFEGVIIFGGVVKKETSPTDLDFIFVGKLPEKARANFSKELTSSLGVQANPLPVEIDLDSNPKRWEEILSIPYLHAPEEWTVQNFVGPDIYRRRLVNSFKKAMKKRNFKRLKP
jgi:predicted nucleotidyltransferase